MPDESKPNIPADPKPENDDDGSKHIERLAEAVGEKTAAKIKKLLEEADAEKEIRELQKITKSGSDRW